MVGLVIASHGHLAEELVATAEQIVGDLPHVATCAIQPGSSLEQIRDNVRHAVSSVDSGEGVLVLTDLFGGTPCNTSLGLCRDLHIEVITGVNLPMLLKASSLRNESLPLSEMAQSLTHYAQKNITCASALMRESSAARHQ